MIHETLRQPSTSALAGQPAPKELLITSPASNANTMRKSPIWMTRNSAWLAGPAGTGDVPEWLTH
jgi:hypothetical protein